MNFQSLGRQMDQVYRAAEAMNQKVNVPAAGGASRTLTGRDVFSMVAQGGSNPFQSPEVTSLLSQLQNAGVFREQNGQFSLTELGEDFRTLNLLDEPTFQDLGIA